jgi:hypothetical protein
MTDDGLVYRHRQTGWVLIVSLSIPAVGIPL